jgi:hypothetical protein
MRLEGSPDNRDRLLNSLNIMALMLAMHHTLRAHGPPTAIKAVIHNGLLGVIGAAEVGSPLGHCW